MREAEEMLLYKALSANFMLYHDIYRLVADLCYCSTAFLLSGAVEGVLI